MLKVCKSCERKLQLSEFTPHKRYSLGVLPHCKSCMNARRPSRAGDRKAIEYSRKYYKENRDAILSKASQKEYTWHKDNRESHNKKNRVWYKNNADYNREKAAKRRASKLSATPKWLTDGQKAHIKRVYKLATLMEEITGENYHVDHIIPLQGKNICGLHIPDNLQVLKADLNLSKSNSYKE